jgi:hypothetical protein
MKTPFFVKKKILITFTGWGCQGDFEPLIYADFSDCADYAQSR